MKNIQHIEIIIEGIVQGVGFRPFIHNLAVNHGLKGFVCNNSEGVHIEVFGDESDIKEFIFNIRNNPPPLSVITSFRLKEITDKKEIPEKFTIKDSVTLNNKKALISPDIALCEECKSELLDKNNRRYYYPFINCTNCGPRYTIIKDIPYDRKNTSMNSFEMCDECKKEYEDPSNRRFHAQPNACFLCGPQLFLTDNKGNIILDARPKPIGTDKQIINERRKITQKIISTVISSLKNGDIVAIKGLGGFHLAVDAENNKAVEKLRERKLRYEKPLAVMSYNFDKIQKYSQIDSYDKLLLESVQKPITLLRKRPKNTLSKSIAPFSDTFGVMLPYTPLHELLLEKDFLALVMTSGNISDEPICISNDEALEKLSSIADLFLLHNRDIYFRCDDAVVKNINLNSGYNSNQDIKIITGSSIKRIYIRRSRGYVPTPIFINKELPPILAIGAELKNTIALIKKKSVFLSQHIGDLENLETFDYFQNTINHLKNILQIDPVAIAYDLHPEYMNTKWVLENEEYNNLDLFGVQHHHAHIVSCMTENCIDSKVIGFAMDGLGYGTDKAIWGGEVLISDITYFERYSHFSYMPLPGGDLAIREPWRIAIAYLYQTYKDDIFKLKIPLLKNLDENKIYTIIRMIERNINTQMTSSLGRLFDAVSALLEVKSFVSYEGQAAIELEALLQGTDETSNSFYNYLFDDNNNISTESIIKNIVEDIVKKTDRKIISRKFHITIIELLNSIATKIRDERGINEVVLSGGCFQNSFLLKNLYNKLTQNNFVVYTHRLVPPNDGGIALGQAIIAGYKYLEKLNKE